MHGADIQELRALIEKGRFASGQGKEVPTAVIPPYQEFVSKQFGRLGREIAVVVDAGNSTGGPVAPQIFRSMGCKVTELFCELDGRFPNHYPDPTVPENLEHLIATVKETGAEIGIAFDGDADRYFGYDDAVYASCRMLEILSKNDKGLTELLADLPPSVTTPEIRVDCPDDIKFDIAQRVCERFRGEYEITDIDGVRVKFDEGWGLVRASNTQPVLVLRFEATTEDKLNEYRTFVEGVVEETKRELENVAS